MSISKVLEGYIKDFVEGRISLISVKPEMPFHSQNQPDLWRLSAYTKEGEMKGYCFGSQPIYSPDKYWEYVEGSVNKCEIETRICSVVELFENQFGKVNYEYNIVPLSIDTV